MYLPKPQGNGKQLIRFEEKFWQFLGLNAGEARWMDVAVVYVIVSFFGFKFLNLNPKPSFYLPEKIQWIKILNYLNS